MKGLQLTGYGAASDVVRLVDVPDVGAPAADEFVIDVEASPIDPTDQYIVAGYYGYQPPLPHLLGSQGVGVVSAVGRDVRHVKEGDRTLVPPTAHTWVSRVKTNAIWLRPLPAGDIDQLSMLAVGPPTAYVLLTEYEPLRPGDWMVQNGANSSVGRAVIAIARQKGIRTVNIVRRPELIDELQMLGGDIVLLDGPELPQRIAAATGGASFMLGLDCVGGAATQRLLETVGEGGTVVIYSGMSGEAAAVSGPHFVFANQTLRGFWITSWLQIPGNLAKFGAICERLAPLVASGAIAVPVAGTFPLAQYPQAFALAAQYRGKAMFRPNAGAG
jgi:NADPH:quinone reductase-like Zn-dependent oxidoreductase